MIPERAPTGVTWVEYIDRTPNLKALFAQLGLVPELTDPGSHQFQTMTYIASVWQLATAAACEDAARLIEAESGLVDHPWARLLRAMGTHVTL